MAKLTEPPISPTVFTSTITRHRAPYPAIDPARPELSAKGKVVLVTGGGQGIGLSIALGFAKANASHIILLGRTLSTLTSGRSRILASYPSVEVHVLVADTTDEKGISNAFTKIHNEIGAINICISNASFLSTLGPIATSDASNWFQSFEVMVKGAIIVAQAFLQHKSDGDAAFVNISSSASQFGPIPGFSAYASAKVAIAKAVEYLQSENTDVRFVSVHPGTIRSEMSLIAGKAYGLEFTFDDYELPGHFCTWVTGPEAAFLSGKYVWAAWDVEELMARKDEILENDILRFGLVQ